MFSSSAGVSVARSATVSAGPACQATKVAPIAGSLPGSSWSSRPCAGSRRRRAAATPRRHRPRSGRRPARRPFPPPRPAPRRAQAKQRGRREHPQQAQAPRPLGDRVLAQRPSTGSARPAANPRRDRERGVQVTERQAQPRAVPRRPLRARRSSGRFRAARHRGRARCVSGIVRRQGSGTWKWICGRTRRPSRVARDGDAGRARPPRPRVHAAADEAHRAGARARRRSRLAPSASPAVNAAPSLSPSG